MKSKGNWDRKLTKRQVYATFGKTVLRIPKGLNILRNKMFFCIGLILFLIIAMISGCQEKKVLLPPTGPFTKAPQNPFTVEGAPYGSSYLLPENLVFHQGKYWVLVADRGPGPEKGVLSLVASTDLVHWKYEGIILSADIVGDPGREFDSPHILQHNGTWYVVYSHYHGEYTEDNTAPIGIAHSTGGILGPYVEDNPNLLTPVWPIGGWEDVRVCEPYLVHLGGDDWVMLYMGDAGEFVEQIGIAFSKSGILGPYVRDDPEPEIAFGPPNSIDAGTVADQWVVKVGDTYYIGYTCSPTKEGWNTTYATTKDWITFTKSNKIILSQGPSGSWDENTAFRGAVTLVGDKYLFSYTGSGSRPGYCFGMASQPAFKKVR